MEPLQCEMTSRALLKGGTRLTNTMRRKIMLENPAALDENLVHGKADEQNGRVGSKV